MINILSIDWDYFVGATVDQRTPMFPNSDNEDFTEKEQAFIWSKCYAESSIGKEFHGQDNIRDIQVLEDEITVLYTLVEKYKKPDTKISLFESHRETADFIIHDFAMHDVINLFNIEFCHDSNTEKLFSVNLEDRDEGKATVINRINKDVQNLHDNPDTLTEDIVYIFLCRSIMRTPPHLDNDYKKMVEQLRELLGLRELYSGSRWTMKKQHEIEYLITQRIMIYKCFVELYKCIKKEGIDNQRVWTEHIKEAQDKLNKLHQGNLELYMWAGSFSSDE